MTISLYEQVNLWRRQGVERDMLRVLLNKADYFEFQRETRTTCSSLDYQEYEGIEVICTLGDHPPMVVKIAST